MSDLDLCLGRRETAIHGAILLSARDNTPQKQISKAGDENSLKLLVLFQIEIHVSKLCRS